MTRFEVDDFLRNLGFRQCQADKCVYLAEFEERKAILALYVDDGLILAKDNMTLSMVINELKHAVEVTVDDPEYYQGMEISKDPRDGSIFIHGRSVIYSRGSIYKTHILTAHQLIHIWC